MGRDIVVVRSGSASAFQRVGAGGWPP
jgi:hypothetical protein